MEGQTNPTPPPVPVQQQVQNTLDGRLSSVQKIVLAAKKVLYSEEMQGRMLKHLDPETPEKSAAEAALVVMGLLAHKSGGKMNPQSFVPAGLIVVADILDYMAKAFEVEITEEMTEAAIIQFTQGVLGLSENAPGEEPAPPQATQPQTPPQAPQPPAPPPATPPQATGLLGGMR